MSRPLLLLNTATLSPAAVATHAPNLQRLAARGSLRPMRSPFPSLSCSSHATMLTGLSPQEHGIVGNGWYEREYAKVFMWNRSSRLMAGEPIWEAARKREPGLRCANLFFRLCADSSCDYIVTERPVYWVSGRKTFDFYSWPPTLHDRLEKSFGQLPFQRFWGPFAGVASTRWILKAALQVMQTERPELMLVYAPYLDYDAERHGARSQQSLAAVRRFDQEVAPLLDAALAEGRDVAIVSDYGWDDAQQPVFINRALRDAGMLDVEIAANGERLQPGTSRAFAVVDNQIAHVYVAAAADRPSVKALLERLPGVAEVLDDAGKQAAGIAHPRAGDLVAVAQTGHWFAYPYWYEEGAKPDFAHCIAIFDKIGFDPTELFLRPGPLGLARAGLRLVQKKLRLAVPFDICSADERQVGGTRKARSEGGEDGALLLTSWAASDTADVDMRDLKALLLARMFES